MGGNTRAIDRQTGEVVTFMGRPAYADKTDFRSVNRTAFKRDFLNALKRLDDLHRDMFDSPIWDPQRRDAILSSGEAFNGSSEHLFSGRLSDAEFVEHKPLVGDIDLTVPSEKLQSIFDLLASMEGQEVTPTVSYIGQNKPEQNGHQINGLFSYVQKGSDQPVFVQIDFEGVKYIGGKPEEFSKFGHSSSWEDVKLNIKGVFHKYILRSLASGASGRSDIVLLTPMSPLSPPEKIKVKKTTSPISLLSFSVDRGLRANAVQQFLPDGSPVVVNGKTAYKEIPTDASDYKRTRSDIFSLIFGAEPEPADLTKLDSFSGILALMDRFLSRAQISEIYLDFVGDKLIGPRSQRLDANSAEVDRNAKMAAVSLFRETFSFLSEHDGLVKSLEDEYYKNYKTRTLESLIRRYVKELLSE